MLLVPMPRGHRLSGLSVADVFSADLYTGNGSTQTITTGINLSANSGLVWLKSRSNTTQHAVLTTTTGAANSFALSGGGGLGSYVDGVTAFTSSGFSLGADTNTADFRFNGNGYTFVSWTFCKAAKFFDVVTYTGNGVAGRTIAHALGQAPGMVITKKKEDSSSWQVYHRSVGATGRLRLDLANGTGTTITAWNNTEPTDAVFTVHSSADNNENATTYIALLFAHDPTGVIQCGSYTGNGSATGPTVTLGWQPQFLMIKRTDTTGGWLIYDSARSTSNPRIKKLLANSTAAEDTADEDVDFNATSFQLKSTDAGINASDGNYIYMAIKAE